MAAQRASGSWTPKRSCAAPRRSIASRVSWTGCSHVVATPTYIESLEISMRRYSHHDCCSPEWVNEWLLYATRRVVKAFCLELAYKPSRLSRLRQILEGLPPYDVDETAVVLPSHGRMASIEMGPSCYRLELPVAATAMYEALTELKLSHVSLDEDAPGSSGRTLDDFVSPCVEHNIAALQVSSPSIFERPHHHHIVAGGVLFRGQVHL
nr:unnamed protein product [Digitaria exilis]